MSCGRTFTYNIIARLLSFYHSFYEEKVSTYLINTYLTTICSSQEHLARLLNNIFYATIDFLSRTGSPLTRSGQNQNITSAPHRTSRSRCENSFCLNDLNLRFPHHSKSHDAAWRTSIWPDLCPQVKLWPGTLNVNGGIIWVLTGLEERNKDCDEIVAWDPTL